MGELSSLYIHVPFCTRKCNYCAFESAVPEEGGRELWLTALEREAELRAQTTARRPRLATCYIGGGTPTVLSPLHWRRLIQIIDKFYDFEDDAEVTVEANPNSLRAEHLLEWRDWRVTRVSIGVQSFDDAELEQMGRLHTGNQAHEAMSAALASGFYVSGDFIFGLPGQSFQNWGRTLREAARCGLHHLSLYQLSIEPGTPWASLDSAALGDGYAAYRFAQWYLPQKGYAQYETANFARPGKESRHNLNYWREGSYIGLGAGAAGYIEGVRYKNFGALARWAGALARGELPIESSEELTPAARAKEAAVLALRTTAGIEAAAYAASYGQEALEALYAKLRKFPDDLCTARDGRIALSQKGMRVANLIWEEII
ncbi:MAG: radical SAM family heme chaperone HemW [Cloacibacillus sp.]